MVNPPVNVDCYTYMVRLCQDTGEYVCMCYEIPGITSRHHCRYEAINEVSERVSLFVNETNVTGETPPKPINDSLVISTDTRKRLREAEEEIEQWKSIVKERDIRISELDEDIRRIKKQ